MHQDISNKTDVFAIFPQDIERAHLFFNKHGLGVLWYVSLPSQREASFLKARFYHIQKYLFIISLRDFNNLDFAAYEVTALKVDRVALRIISDANFSVKDIHGDGSKKTFGTGLNAEGTPDYNDASLLNQQIDNLFNQSSNYQKQLLLER